MEMGNQHHSAVTLPGEKTPATHEVGGWVSPSGLSGWFGEEKNLLPMLGFSTKTAQCNRCMNYSISAREEISLCNYN